jgi:hypothetical protein
VCDKLTLFAPPSWQSLRSLADSLTTGISLTNAPITPTTAGARMARRETKTFMASSFDLNVGVCFERRKLYKYAS